MSVTIDSPRVAIITGASRGIGAAIALLLARLLMLLVEDSGFYCK